MDPVFRAAAVYLFLLLVFRLAGRRSLAQMTSFDFVLLLIIGEATQQALLGEDFSLTNGAIVIVSLITIDIVLSLAKSRFSTLANVMDGMPMVIVEDGRPLMQRMRRARLDVDDVLEAARASRGLERLDQIKFAVLEVSGGISVLPKDGEERGQAGR